LEFATSSSSGEIRELILVESQQRITCLEEPNKKEFERLEQNGSQQKATSRSRDKYVRATPRAADTTPKSMEFKLPENGSQRVSDLPASGSKRSQPTTPAKLLRNRLGNPFRVGDEDTGRRREIAAGHLTQTRTAKDGEQPHES
jgi:hypothetical protein